MKCVRPCVDNCVIHHVLYIIYIMVITAQLEDSLYI